MRTHTHTPPLRHSHTHRDLYAQAFLHTRFADLIDMGWRRSGTYLYKVCRHCSGWYLVLRVAKKTQLLLACTSYLYIATLGMA